MGVVGDLILVVILILLVLLFWPKIMALIQLGSSVIGNNQSKFNFTYPTNRTNTTTKSISFGPVENYTLYLINKDRNSYGLSNVTLSSEPSAQQHADSMLEYNYFSHWDPYGMKPYMRYTLLGGKGAVQENVAYTKSGVKACIGSICSTYGNVNVSNSIQSMEYNMVYNDSSCCNNGHRDNILDPNHNQVSIGVAYNSTSVYLVEDFINNYITWLNGTPSYGSREVTLKGTTSQGYQLSSVEVGYEPMVSPMTQQQLDSTSEYSYGTTVAGVVQNSLQYYPDLTTIVADTYYTQGNNFLVQFNMSKLVNQYGAGEYTIGLWLNGTASNSSFVGSTYTIFLNQNGSAYVPSQV